MKRMLTVLGILAVTGTVVFGRDVPGFQKTFADALRLAKSSGKPMYLHFTTDWCGWCRKMESETYASDAGKKALADFVPASLDCTDANRQRANLDMMHKYGGSGYPFLLVIAEDGAVLNSWAGYIQTNSFVNALAQANKVYAEYKQFQKDMAKENKATYEYNAKGLRMYVKVKKWDSILTCANAMVRLDPKMEKADTLEAKYAILDATIATSGSPIALKTAFESVKKSDAANEKGYWEKAALDVMEASLKAKNYKDTVAVITDLTSKAAKLKNGVEVWCRLAIVYTVAGDSKGAEAAMAKAKAVEGGDAQLIARYENKIAKIKSR